MLDQSLSCASVLTTEGWVTPAIIQLDDKGFIESVEKLAPNAPVDHGHIVPGMANLHSHAFQRQMAGLSGLPGPEGDSFWTWRELMYRLALRIQPGQLQAIAAFLQVEMLENGYTSCAEFHYLHHQPNGQAYDNLAEMSAQLVDAAAKSGIALTLLPVFYSRSGFAQSETNERQRRFKNTTDQYLGLWQACRDLVAGRPLMSCGMAPHSLRAVSPQQLHEVLQANQAVEQAIHIHIAEQELEVRECVEVLGARPVQWLLEQYDVNESWCLVHATHMDQSEVDRLSACGPVVGLCPSTEADLGDGYFAIEDWFNRSGRFGIGSDSNLRLSPAGELRMLEFQARLQSGRRNVLAEHGRSCGRSLYERALAGGAQALAQRTGCIAKGFRADLLELDPEHPMLAGRTEDSLLDSWLLAGGKSMIRKVWVGGQRQVDEGRHVARGELEPAFRKAMVDLL
jgi:formiminoglutamate deiminase